MRHGQIRVPVQIPAGSTGLSLPVNINGYRIAAIEMPGVWAAATMTFRGRGTQFNSPDQVRPNGAVASLGPDANAEDIQMGAAVQLIHRTQVVKPQLVDPIVIDTLLVPGGTIDVNDEGILWVFQQITGGKEAGIVAVQVDKNAADYATPIEAWAQYSVSTRVMPPREFLVPIGAVHVIEGGSGAFTWGTDSIAAEGETYHNFSGVPEVLVRVASLALDGGAATFTYGAVKVRLGTGLLVTMTGKVNVVIAGTNVVDGDFGAWILLGLGDDVEIALQLGFDYPTLADANAAIEHHLRNPMLAHFGSFTVENQSGGAFVPGTTFLDAANITAIFTTEGPILSDVDDDAGGEVAITVEADRFVVLAADLKENLSGLQAIQVRSGTQATPVPQPTSPTVDLILEKA